MLLVALHDEFSGGLPIAGAAEVVSSLALSAFAYASLVFGVPGLVAMVVEAPILAWSDRHRAERPRLVTLGLVGCAFALAVEAWALGVGSGVLLTIGVTISFPCSGLACGLAEAILVDDARATSAEADGTAAVLARWTLAGVIGDVLAPAFVFVVAALLGIAGVLTAGAVVVPAITIAVGRGVDTKSAAPDDSDADDDEGDRIAVTVRTALTTRALLSWSLACALCGLLDETLASLAALAAAARLGPAWPGVLLGAFSLGAAAGTLIVERVVSGRPWRPVLAASAVICVMGFSGFLFAIHAGAATAAAVALAVAGAGAAPLWPLTLTACHEAMPGRPGVLGAVSSLFSPIDMIAPIALGAHRARRSARRHPRADVRQNVSSAPTLTEPPRSVSPRPGRADGGAMS